MERLDQDVIDRYGPGMPGVPISSSQKATYSVMFVLRRFCFRLMSRAVSPGARVDVTGGARYLAPVESPEEFTRIVRAFYNDPLGERRQ